MQSIWTRSNGESFSNYPRTPLLNNICDLGKLYFYLFVMLQNEMCFSPFHSYKNYTIGLQLFVCASCTQLQLWLRFICYFLLLYGKNIYQRINKKYKYNRNSHVTKCIVRFYWSLIRLLDNFVFCHAMIRFRRMHFFSYFFVVSF